MTNPALAHNQKQPFKRPIDMIERRFGSNLQGQRTLICLAIWKKYIHVMVFQSDVKSGVAPPVMSAKCNSTSTSCQITKLHRPLVPYPVKAPSKHPSHPAAAESVAWLSGHFLQSDKVKLFPNGCFHPAPQFQEGKGCRPRLGLRQCRQRDIRCRAAHWWKDRLHASSS